MIYDAWVMGIIEAESIGISLGPSPNADAWKDHQ
jgi:hypothetical protein